jgi:endonuclease/exonuclease/phosphatase family metal-dependent hydrolase
MITAPRLKFFNFVQLRQNQFSLLPLLALFFTTLQSIPAFAASSLEIMSYNVENLFDSVHDEDKEDYTFLSTKSPLKKAGCARALTFYYRKQCYETDWNERKLNVKLNQIKRLVLEERERLPNVLALTEVENEKVLSRLAETLGYTDFVMTNSPDQRGIDVALLYKLPKGFKKISHKEHNLFEMGIINSKTRNLLQVTFQAPGPKAEKIHVFVNHWPSQASPTEKRLQIAQYLAAQIKEILKIKGNHVVAVGDFNTLPKETPNPIGSTLTTKKNPLLYDLQTEFEEKAPEDLVRKLPPGSHYYASKKSWSHLDKILVSKGLLEESQGNENSVQVDLETYDIYAPDFITTHSDKNNEDSYDDTDKVLEEVVVNFEMDYQVNSYRGAANNYNNNSHDGFVTTRKSLVGTSWPKTKVPVRYDFTSVSPDTAGFSDHLPLVIEIKY